MRILKPDLRRWPRPTVPSVREKRAYYKLITGATSYRLSMVNGTAFLWVPGVDLTRYAGQTGSHTPFYVSVTDSTGKIAEGYIAAAGGGETLGAEILINPTFDVNTTDWYPDNCTVASIAGGQSNNCLELTRTLGNYQQAIQDTGINGQNKLYLASGYVKSGTSGNEAGNFHLWLDAMVVLAAFTTTAAWVQYSRYYTPTVSNVLNFRGFKNTNTAGTMLFDEVSLKQVTDCAATGVHIVSARGGATRNWTSITAGFNPNDTSYSTVIERIGNH